MQLVELGKGERDYVVKPSGFSELAWGSRGVKIANDLTKEEWTPTLDDALGVVRTHAATSCSASTRAGAFACRTSIAPSDEIKQFDGRVRLCPYYFVTGETTVQLGGILATVAPADKRLIHGMGDAVMAPIIREREWVLAPLCHPERSERSERSRGKHIPGTAREDARRGTSCAVPAARVLRHVQRKFASCEWRKTSSLRLAIPGIRSLDYARDDKN